MLPGWPGLRIVYRKTFPSYVGGMTKRGHGGCNPKAPARGRAAL